MKQLKPREITVIRPQPTIMINYGSVGGPFTPDIPKTSKPKKA